MGGVEVNFYRLLIFFEAFLGCEFFAYMSNESKSTMSHNSLGMSIHGLGAHKNELQPQPG